LARIFVGNLSSVISSGRFMLLMMEQPVKTLPSPSAPSFASLLASFAAPETEGSRSATDWDNEELADDVVALSYGSMHQAGAAREIDAAEPRGEKNQNDAVQNDAGAEESTGAAGTLRTASVTIRLNSNECAMLRQRATEAGLTVSAYVRSCTLEADALRAQVKQALAEMKSSAEMKTTAENDGAAAVRHRWLGPWLRWMGRIRKHS
jgi:hypothetical protein